MVVDSACLPVSNLALDSGFKVDQTQIVLCVVTLTVSKT